MIIRELKLKLTKKQEIEVSRWLCHLTSVYNWAIQRIKLNANNKIYFNKFDFQNSLVGTSHKLGIPSHVITGTLMQAYMAWQRCFKKISGEPKLKGRRRKLNSIPFPDSIKAPIDNKIKLPYLKEMRFYKQDLPDGKIKNARLIKRASGWYLILVIDALPNLNITHVKETNETVGIDPGFSTLLTLSNGVKIDNPRELGKQADRLGQAQRGRRKRLTARLHEKQTRTRRDRNHKISRELLINYKTIYWSNDNFKGMSRSGCGKSVAGAGLGQLILMMNYKSKNCGREVIKVSNFNSTRSCNVCLSLTGPTGRSDLAVRHWECGACGASHDRDINAAVNTLNVGLGHSLKVPATGH